MTIRSRVVHIHQLPKQMTMASKRRFLHEVRKQVATERPCLVLDCCNVQSFDISVIRLLLSCLEEVMKRNGDVRLAALGLRAEATLQMSGLGRLFEVYTTKADAVRSFQKRSASIVPLAVETEDIDHDSSYAA